MGKVYQTATDAGHTLCPTHFVPNVPHNAAHARCPQVLDPKKKVPQTKPMWLIAFAGEFGDVVGQALPHGIFDTPEDTLDRDFPQSQGWCVLDFFLYLSGSVGGAWGARFSGNLPA